jgi:hypothetical protein
MMKRHKACWNSSNVSDERVVSIFSAGGQANQVCMKQEIFLPGLHLNPEEGSIALI